MDIDINTFYDIRECIDNKESRVLKGAFPDIFSVEEFNRLLNLRSFQTTQRLTPTKQVKSLTKWKALSDEDKREPWVKDTTTIPPSLVEEVINSCVCYWPDSSRVNEKINDLAFQLEEMSDENCDAHIFFSVKKELENFFGAHYDTATNLIVQAVGRPHWRCCKYPVDTSKVPPNVKNIEDYGVYIDEVLEPGDAIFIPKEVLHEPRNLTPRISVSFPMRSRDKWLKTKNPRQDRKWLNVDFN